MGFGFNKNKKGGIDLDAARKIAGQIGDAETKKRLAESKKLSDSINAVSSGKFSITDIRDTLRKKSGLK